MATQHALSVPQGNAPIAADTHETGAAPPQGGQAPTAGETDETDETDETGQSGALPEDHGPSAETGETDETDETGALPQGTAPIDETYYHCSGPASAFEQEFDPHVCSYDELFQHFQSVIEAANKPRDVKGEAPDFVSFFFLYIRRF